MRLHPANLPALAARVDVPTYERDALARSIVHIGVGGFHRAHLASYVDELATAGFTQWGIVGSGVLPQDVRVAEALTPQHGLYTLVTRSATATHARVIGSVVEYVLATPRVDPLVERIADAATQMVSLTVTESGYPIDGDSGTFDDSSRNAADGSAFAAIVRALRRRHASGAGPLTVLSCDNIVGNGRVARTAVLGVAARLAPEIVDWIAAEVAFPSSVVDRITPQTVDADRSWVREQLGVEDRWPVVTEPFRQWVVEDRFAAARPPLEELDVIVTDDVEPYEAVKLRLLNAAHSMIAYLAGLARIERVDEVLADAQFALLVRRFLDDEAAPVLPSAAGIDLEEYKSSLLIRFANPAIGDRVQRLCADGSAKIPTFILPTVRAQLVRDGPVHLAALAVAGWCAYLSGRSPDGRTLHVAGDPLLSDARRFAAASEAVPERFLQLQQVFGDDLRGSERFAAAFVSALHDIRTAGVRGAIDRALATSPSAGRIDGPAGGDA